ncbi:MAG: hypothetical protein E7353_03050 [Clostridiales bacterium]|nr:hypothetical protein [Clostridiales bacterium]
MKSTTKYVLNVLLIIVLSVLTAWYLSKTQIITPTSLLSLKWTNCIFVVTWVYMCFAFLSLIEKHVYSSFCNYPYKTAFLTTVYGALGSAVSPLKSAHFPLKVYAQKTNGMTIAQTLTGITKCQIIFSATSIVVYAVLMAIFIFSKAKLNIADMTLPTFTVVGIGFVSNVSIFILLTLISRIDKLRTVILRLLAFIASIFNRKLNKEEFMQKKTERLNLFKEQTSAIFSKFYLFIFPSLAYVLYMFLSCLAPYVSYLCVSGTGFSFNDCIRFYTCALALTYLVNVIPIPGGCVVAEFVFSVVFAPITGVYLSRTLLLWRFCTYYIPTTINLGIFVVSSIKSTKRNT